jgi:hypothetical protein
MNRAAAPRVCGSCEERRVGPFVYPRRPGVLWEWVRGCVRKDRSVPCVERTVRLS